MFEEKTYEKIMQDKLNRVPSDVDKREGSVVYDALAPNAMEFREELYSLLKSLMYLEIMAEKIAPKRNFTEDMSNIFTEILLYK